MITEDSGVAGKAGEAGRRLHITAPCALSGGGAKEKIYGTAGS